MLDTSSGEENFLTREGPSVLEAPFPPPSNREPKGCLNSFLSSEVTKLYVIVHWLLQSSPVVIVKFQSGLWNYVNMNDRE